MHDVSVDALVQRLNQVKREIYWWKLTVVVVAGLSLLLGASSSKVPEEIRAKRFLVIDPAGNSVGEFSAKEGQPTLKLSDPVVEHALSSLMDMTLVLHFRYWTGNVPWET